VIGARWHVRLVVAPKGRGAGLKILYRNPRRPGEAGMKLVPDQSQRVEEKNILERLGFTVVEITSAPFALTRSRNSATGPGALKV
jgi:hypothetical protein